VALAVTMIAAEMLVEEKRMKQLLTMIAGNQIAFVQIIQAKRIHPKRSYAEWPEKQKEARTGASFICTFFGLWPIKAGGPIDKIVLFRE
jgi:hypothetical protein